MRTTQLDKLRREMPQIPGEKLGDFARFMRGRGVSVSNRAVPASELKATQSDINGAKIGRMKKRGLASLLGGHPVVVAGDHELLDGHHRAAAIEELDAEAKVPALVLHCPIADAIDHAEAYPHATKRGILDGKVAFSLDVAGLGLGGFRLDQAAPRRFTKDVLRVGSWVHPATGQKLKFTRSDLGELASDTNDFIAEGNKSYFPDGHTNSALSNMGSWSNFRVDGDTLMADVDVADDEAAGKVGKTITDVSPAIEPNVLSSNGRTYKAVIVHVAATPEPVIPSQGNFVRLSREGSVTAPGHNFDNKEQPVNDLLSLSRKKLGLPEDADEKTVCAALEKVTLAKSGESDKQDEEDDAEEDEEDGGVDEEDEKEKKMSAKLSRELDERDRRIKALEDDRTARIKRAAEERVELARRRSAELGVPLEKDVADEALELLSREDHVSNKAGARLLELANSRSEAKSVYERTLASPNQRIETEEPNPILLSSGYKANKDEKGRVTGYSKK